MSSCAGRTAESEPYARAAAPRRPGNWQRSQSGGPDSLHYCIRPLDCLVPLAGHWSAAAIATHALEPREKREPRRHHRPLPPPEMRRVFRAAFRGMRRGGAGAAGGRSDARLRRLHNGPDGLVIARGARPVSIMQSAPCTPA